MKGFLRVRDKPSVYEVARLAGVSTATVSRVLAGYERVLPRTRDKVLTAVTELGYVPSGAARDLAARRTGVLGLCFPDLDTEDGDAAYWYDEVIRGMERAARRSGYAVLIAASHHRDDSGLVLSIAGRCDGLVVLARTAPLAMIEHVATRIPVVSGRDQHRVPAAPGGPLHAPDHLVVPVGGVAVFGVQVGEAQPEHPGAPCRQVPGRAARHVAELGDRGEHLVPGPGEHALVAR